MNREELAIRAAGLSVGECEACGDPLIRGNNLPQLCIHCRKEARGISESDYIAILKDKAKRGKK